MSVHEKLDERVLRYFKLVVGRAQGSCDEEIVKELADSGISSPQVLYQHLAKDGFPICRACGKTPAGEGHCKEPEKKRDRKARRSGGEKKELPFAGGAAAEFFGEALRRLEHDISELSRRREYIQNERFFVERHLSGESGESYLTYIRTEEPEAAWQDFCERHGADPSLDSFTVWEDRIVSGGASWAPPEPLTRLIAVYILSGEPLEPLLRVLHDDPEAADTEGLERHIYGKKSKTGISPGLLYKAQQVAHLVRGGKSLSTGSRSPDLSPKEEEAAAYICFSRSRGASDDETLQNLRNGFGFTSPRGLFADPRDPFADPEKRPWPDMTMDDLKRLGNFRLPSMFGDGT